ncbi:MAG TPA: hypothetical protein VMU59_14145 [Caulobacteraceae bacterium]|nr:hypothetical protein [Caulobacteraceae bacterium]
MTQTRLCAAVALALAALASAAAGAAQAAPGPIGYTAPDGVNAVAVTAATPLPQTDVGGASNNAPFQGEVALTVGAADSQARRTLKATCTAAGNVSVTYADGSTGVWAAQAGQQTWPIAITTVNASGTTATCAYANLK